MDMHTLLACSWVLGRGGQLGTFRVVSCQQDFILTHLPGLQASTGERGESLIIPFVRLRSSLQSTFPLSQYLEAHRRFVFNLFGD